MAIPGSNITQVDFQLPGIFVQLFIFAKSNMYLLFPGLAILYLGQVMYYLSLHPLHKIPGPVLARFSRIWKNIRYFRSTWHDDVLELHEKYGPVVRIAPNEVSFVDAKALSILYGHGTAAKKVGYRAFLQRCRLKRIIDSMV
jgi:hypothetical protein